MSSELTPQVAGQLELDSVQFRALLYEVGEKTGCAFGIPPRTTVLCHR